MIKLLLIAGTICISYKVAAQQDMIVFKKKDKPLAYFRKDSYIVFQLQNKEWYTGFINQVRNDSFDINPMVIHLTMHGPDTVHYALLKVAIKDVYGMPRKGELVNYKNERAYIILGHEHWVWLKNGLIFRAGAAGYVLLSVINGLLKKTTVLTGTQIGIAAGVFVVGEILHQTYKPTHKLGKKYRLESVRISN